MSMLTVPYTHIDSAKLLVTSTLISSLYLHNEIREKGGAYGGGCSYNHGIISFYSYRDPNSLQTIEIFKQASNFINNSNNYTDQDITEALLTIFSRIDSPISIANRASSIFIHHLSNEQRKTYRKQLLAVTKDDIIQMAQKYFTMEYIETHSSCCIIGNQDTIPDQSQLINWNIQTL